MTQPESSTAVLLGEWLVDGVAFIKDAKGHMVPKSTVKQHELLEDEMVRDIVARARAKADEIRAFKEALLGELDAFNEILDEKFKVTRRGEKGNQTFTSYDGLMRVQLATSDTITFGAGLQQAKALIDECLIEWSAKAPPQLIAIVTRAFDVGVEGKVNAKELFALKRYNFDDPRWLNAMAAIDDAVRITGSKRFTRFAFRDKPDGQWVNIAINIAVA
jgi:hypothetical protein